MIDLCGLGEYSMKSDFCTYFNLRTSNKQASFSLLLLLVIRKNNTVYERSRKTLTISKIFIMSLFLVHSSSQQLLYLEDALDNIRFTRRKIALA